MRQNYLIGALVIVIILAGAAYWAFIKAPATTMVDSGTQATTTVTAPTKPVTGTTKPTTSTGGTVTTPAPTPSPSTDVRPKITSTSPSTVTVGTVVTIHGTHFDTSATNIVTFGDTAGKHHPDGTSDNQIASEVSKDGTTLTFTVPNTGPSGMLCDQSNQCVAVASMLLQDGSYKISVLNKNGLSNTYSVTFKR